MKTPERRQASSGVVGEQLNLIDPPPFSPIWPSPSSLPGKALTLLLAGRTLTHPSSRTSREAGDCLSPFVPSVMTTAGRLRPSRLPAQQVMPFRPGHLAYSSRRAAP